MHVWRQWLGVGAALGIIGVLVPGLFDPRALPLQVPAAQAPLELSSAQPAPPAPSLPRETNEPDFGGLDLLHLDESGEQMTSPLVGSLFAELTLEPDLERTARRIMDRYGVPEAGTILMDVKTGNLLVYASRVGAGVPFDVNLRAEAPAASVFKIITASALLETHAVNSETEQCYHGGQSRIRADELRDNPARDRACASLATALGHSLNVVFARLAQKHLTPERLRRMASAYGFGTPTPFDVPAQPPLLDLPSDPVEFARAAAGFWHSSLSPLAAVSIAATVANGGVFVRPRIVRAVRSSTSEIPVWQPTSEPGDRRRVLPEPEARELGTMMQQTVSAGSASRAFHDRGRPYLGDIHVAGKTGTLARQEQDRFYTWFVGFAPAEKPEVAVAALVVNSAVWRIKAPQLARDVLRSYFAKRHHPGVSPP